MRVLIVGPGAIGGLLASLLLTKGHEVICLVKNQTSLEKIGDSVTIKSRFFGDMDSKLTLVLDANGPFDIIILAVKSPGLEPSIEHFSESVSEATIIVTLLNGIGHRELLRRYFPKNVIVGTIGHVEAFLDEKRIINHINNHPPTIEIAVDKEIERKELLKIEDLFSGIGIKVNVLPSENQVIWRKLVRLSAIGSVGSCLQKTLGEILSDDTSSKLLFNVIQELTEVAKFESVDIDPLETFKQIQSFNPLLVTSLQRDLLNQLPSEIIPIVERPLNLGKSYGLAMINLQYCYDFIRNNFNLIQL